MSVPNFTVSKTVEIDFYYEATFTRLNFLNFYPQNKHENID